MASSTELTSHQKFERLKKLSRRATVGEQIEAGERRFERMGVEREDVEGIARAVGLEAEDIYLASCGRLTVLKMEQPRSEGDESDCDVQNFSQRLRRLEVAVSGMAGGHARAASQSDNCNDGALVAEIRRIADHFVPVNLEVVGTSYVAERLGVTKKWVGDLVRSGRIPKLCICPKSGSGNYWRFWKAKIDKWIEEK